MPRTAIVHPDTNEVINVVCYPQPVATPEEYPGCFAVAHQEALVGWRWNGSTLVPPPPPRRQVPKSLIISRLTDAQLDAALALMTTRQKERWRSPDHPAVNSDDADTLAVLEAIGADAAFVMSP
jgi:hypothetical protein